MRSLSVRGFCFVLGLLISCSVASAQFGEYSLGAGYSHLHTGTSPGLFYDKDGAYIDGDFAWHFPYPGSPALLGFGLTGTGYWDSQDVAVQNGNNVFGEENLNSDLGNFEIEPRFALEFWLPRTNIFLKPRIGAGLLVNTYSIDQVAQNGNFTIFNTLNHTGAAFEIRPAIQAGVGWGPAAAGLELSYMSAWGGFGAFGNHAQEFRAGAFISLRF
ncbi:MAG: hypothetical protein ABSB74_08070 [Tepidisphaeraceae bacterium]